MKPEAKPPYTENACPACERGEEVIIPGHSSIVGSGGVHAPSGHVCLKYIEPRVAEILANRKR